MTRTGESSESSVDCQSRAGYLEGRGARSQWSGSVAKKRLLECSFLIPIRRDKNLSDGKVHRTTTWTWLEQELGVFGGATRAPDHTGWYLDPDTRERVTDRSRKYIVALPRARVESLRNILGEACDRFAQKCIYLSVAGYVEFVEGARHEED